MTQQEDRLFNRIMNNIMTECSVECQKCKQVERLGGIEEYDFAKWVIFRGWSITQRLLMCSRCTAESKIDNKNG